MDGGILYGGEIRGEPNSKHICGVIARFDSQGDELWHDNIYEESCDAICSTSQLSLGGYIAAGRAVYSGSYVGFLLKYAPELGIEEPDPATSLGMTVSPNPCCSSLSVSFSLADTGNASVRIFDLSGKLISLLADGVYPAGSSTVEWLVPDEVSTGCYMIRCCTESESITESIVLLR